MSKAEIREAERILQKAQAQVSKQLSRAELLLAEIKEDRAHRQRLLIICETSPQHAQPTP